MENTKNVRVNKILFFVSALLLVSTISLTCYIFTNPKNNLENNQTNNQQSSEQTSPTYDEIKTLPITDNEALKLYNSVMWPVCSKQLEYYYQQDKLLAKDMPEYLRQALAFLNVENSHFHDDGVSLEAVEKEYKKLFGNAKKFVFQFIEYDSEIGKNEWIWHAQKENDKYGIAVGDTACFEGSPGKIVAIEKNISQNEIYIYEKVLFWKYLDDDMEKVNLYSDSERTKLVIENYNSMYSHSLLEEYADKLDTYKYTFKQDTAGNYNFISVEKVK